MVVLYMAFVLGITGGIATGKSTVMRLFATLGARVISADEIAREVLAKDAPAYYDVIERFGSDVVLPNGEIDRAALGHIIFNDPDARNVLEEITHSRIISRMQEHIEQFRKSLSCMNSILVVEIPLLFECGLEDIVDEVLLVAAEQGTQIDRLKSRNEISSDEALRRIDAQMPMEVKIGKADRVIWNDGSLQNLEQTIRHIWEEIRLP